jgi:hypothetical protein
MLSLPKITVLAVLCAALAVGCRAQAGVEPAPTRSDVASSSTRPAKSLPEPFASVLPEIKAKSRIPVLLPSELSQPIRGAKHEVAERASDNEYAITLYYELGIGDAGFAASFGAQADPDYDPQDLGNIRKVELSHGLLGYFRPVRCGGSCAPANMWWKDGRVLYQIQLGFPSTLREGDQQKAIIATADSAMRIMPPLDREHLRVNHTKNPRRKLLQCSRRPLCAHSILIARSPSR